MKRPKTTVADLRVAVWDAKLMLRKSHARGNCLAVRRQVKVVELLERRLADAVAAAVAVPPKAGRQRGRK